MFRNVQTCVLCLAAVVLANVAAAFAADKAEKPEKASPAANAAMTAMIQEAFDEDRYVPEIEKGVVVGQSPRAVKLMEYVVADYKSRTGDGVEGITYSVAVGIGDKDPAITSGQFRKGAGPLATYLLVLGPGVEKSTLARLSRFRM